MHNNLHSHTALNKSFTLTHTHYCYYNVDLMGGSWMLLIYDMTSAWVCVRVCSTLRSFLDICLTDCWELFNIFLLALYTLNQNKDCFEFNSWKCGIYFHTTNDGEKCVCVSQQFSYVDISPDGVRHALIEAEPHITVAHSFSHRKTRTLLTYTQKIRLRLWR